MAKAKDAFRTISEVAEWLDTPTHVLRFWESKFSQIKPVKGAGGRRYYRPSDMDLLGGIKQLLHEDGLTIKGTQKLLREKGVKYVATLGPSMTEPVPDVATKPPKPIKPAPVAIKVLDSGPAVLATAMHATEEAGMARAVDHPNVVRMYDSFLEPDLGHVVVMELATAGSLERAWNTNATLAEASELVEQLCEGLTACHRVGLIHGDIKAANVLMCAPDGHEQPTPKLADFGIARSLRHPADQRRADTTSQLIMGNAAGLAPELIEGSPPSVTSDVFGLGALLLWLCTGYSIPQGEDHDQTANATRQHWLDALHERDPALHAICDKSLCGLPEGRFSNPEALRDALTAWRTGQVIPEVRIPPLPSVIRWLRSHRRAALGAATLAIASTALITLGGTTLERRAFQRGIHEAQATAASLIGDETDGRARGFRGWMETSDRKSTRLNSSHPSRSRMPSSA